MTPPPPFGSFPKGHKDASKFNLCSHWLSQCVGEGVCRLDNKSRLFKILWICTIPLQCFSGVHKSFHPTIRDGSTWSKSGARGEHGDVVHWGVLRFSNLGALWFLENCALVLGEPCSGSWRTVLNFKEHNQRSGGKWHYVPYWRDALLSNRWLKSH